ncbi:MAG: DnaJ domain-containing protein [Flavobacteriales bacterium]|nr:DnaJ domain-containing protein [Flavobacteriales bacterium]
MLKDYYKTLGLTLVADQTALESAFKQSAMKHHPRFSKIEGAASTFLDVFEAFEVLCNVNNRFVYDNIRLLTKHNEKMKISDFKLKKNKRIEEEHSEVIGSWKRIAGLKAKYYGNLSYEELIGSDLFSISGSKSSSLIKIMVLVMAVVGSPVLVLFYNISVLEILLVLMVALFYYYFMSWVFRDDVSGAQ